MAEIKCEITRHIATISEKAGGWNLELNMVKWNDAPAKYDIRNWSPDHEKSSKQASFSLEELMAIKSLLNDIFPD